LYGHGNYFSLLNPGALGQSQMTKVLSFSLPATAY
jgi:hypothetical protein